MKKFWKAVGIAAVWVGLFLLVQLFVTFSAMMFLLAKLVSQEGVELFLNQERFLELYMSGTVSNLTAIILLSNLLSIFLVWVIFKFRGKSFSREIGLNKTSGRNLAMSVLFGVGLCFTVDLVTRLLPVPENIMAEFEAEHGMLWGGSIALTFLSVALIGPISEEIFFRGLSYTRLKMGMRPWIAAVISAVFFGLVHGNPVWFLVGFLAGLGLSWVFETTGSLWPAILVHVTNNTISSLSAYIHMTEGIHYGMTVAGLALLIVSIYFLYVWNRPEESASQPEP